MIIRSFSIVLLWGIFTSLQAQNYQEKADEYLNRHLELKRFNGAVLVATNQKVLFNKGYGMADYEHSTPVDRTTMFCITGLTEQFTAYITLKVIIKQKLPLHDPIKNLLGDLEIGNAEILTLHQLLTHTSGLPDFPLMHQLPKNQIFSKEELISYIGNIPLENKYETQFSYSKLNYNLIGLILENVTGKPFEQLLRDYITEPLGMKNTLMNKSSYVLKNRANGYIRKSYVVGWENSPFLDSSNTFASQGVLSTVNDLLKWNRHVMEKYSTDTTLQTMLRSSDDGFSYGLHASRGKTDTVKQINSIGVYTSGFNSFSSVNLEDNLIIIVLGNCRNPISRDIAEGLHSIFTDKNYKLPLLRETVKIAPDLLQELEGDYKINDNVTIRIFVDEDQLFINDGMRPKVVVFPQSESQFFFKEIDAEIVFIRNTEGEVTQIELRNDGFTNAYANKISQ